MAKKILIRVNKKDIYRILDVNLNRCREGLRVIEDIYRFKYNREREYRRLRNIRHQLNRIFSKIHPQLLVARQAREDFGQRFKERKRENIEEILIANFKRVEEGLRVLEEFVRLVSKDIGKKLKAIRYSIYEIEKRLLKNRIV